MGSILTNHDVDDGEPCYCSRDSEGVQYSYYDSSKKKIIVVGKYQAGFDQKKSVPVFISNLVLQTKPTNYTGNICTMKSHSVYAVWKDL